MPKILINEKDKTSPGTPDSYSNFTVLVVGFAGRDPVLTADATDDVKADAIQPDSNGVYEFSSADGFKETIGLVKPKKEFAGGATVYHYGNQMAYELLNLGYSIIYKPIQDIDELLNEDFWEIYKDKASYDFRFITHGLLESSFMTSEDKATYESVEAALAEVNAAVEALAKIAADVNIKQEEDASLEITAARNEAYDLIKNDYPGFKLVVTTNAKTGLTIESSADAYATYADAEAALTGENGAEALLEAESTRLLGGGITTAMINKVNTNIANLAKYVADEAASDSVGYIPGRGDCIALIELDEAVYLKSDTTAKPEHLIIQGINQLNQIDAQNGRYCAMTVPSVYYNMSIDKEKPNEFDNNVKFPGAFHYLACFINSLKLGFAEWYAAAGYTRGISSYKIDYTSVKLGEIAINALEPRNYNDPQSSYPAFACNVIAYFRGSYYLWGNRTAHPLGKKGSLTDGDLVASSFLNIRQLCCTIKKQLYVACRTFTFDPNSDTLWVNFVNAIKPTLEAMKADQGIRDYKILKEFTDKKATLKAKIRIIPIEAVEDFDLTVSLEDSFGETAAVVTE